MATVAQSRDLVYVSKWSCKIDRENIYVSASPKTVRKGGFWYPFSSKLWRQRWFDIEWIIHTSKWSCKCKWSCTINTGNIYAFATPKTFLEEGLWYPSSQDNYQKYGEGYDVKLITLVLVCHHIYANFLKDKAIHFPPSDIWAFSKKCYFVCRNGYKFLQLSSYSFIHSFIYLLMQIYLFIFCYFICLSVY